MVTNSPSRTFPPSHKSLPILIGDRHFTQLPRMSPHLVHTPTPSAAPCHRHGDQSPAAPQLQLAAQPAAAQLPLPAAALPVPGRRGASARELTAAAGSGAPGRPRRRLHPRHSCTGLQAGAWHATHQTTDAGGTQEVAGSPMLQLLQLLCAQLPRPALDRVQAGTWHVSASIAPSSQLHRSA
jgi:hypothetical protein